MFPALLSTLLALPYDAPRSSLHISRITFPATPSSPRLPVLPPTTFPNFPCSHLHQIYITSKIGRKIFSKPAKTGSTPYRTTSHLFH
jgi:hypothetical protein